MSKVEHIFLVKGSEPEPYTVTVTKDGKKLMCTCTCHAAIFHTHCKHRMRILLGDTSDVVSDNIDAVERIPNLVAGTNVQQAMEALSDAEEGLKEAQAEVRSRKKALARVLES